jgi:isoleucyl-tRNA synthetase
VTLAGVTLAPDEVEIHATPRPGTVVAGDEGLVVVLDTQLTPDLVAEGDARELQRAIQDLRKDAGLELDDRIDLWVANASDDVAQYLAAVAAEVLADGLNLASPDGAAPATHGGLELAGGPVEIWIRRRGEG